MQQRIVPGKLAPLKLSAGMTSPPKNVIQDLSKSFGSSSGKKKKGMGLIESEMSQNRIGRTLLRQQE